MPQLPRDTDTPAVTDDEIWQECASRLRLAIEAEGQNRGKAIEALEFGDGHQWPDDLYNQRKINRRPSLTINHTNTFVRRIVNNMRQQRPRIKVHPVGDGANVDKANVLAGLIRHIENRSNATVAYDTGGESAVRMGWGYWRVHSEWLDEASMEQELCIATIRNPFTVYLDPSAVMPAGEDADWCIITEMMDRQEYARQYPESDNKEWRWTEWLKFGAGDEAKAWETKKEIRLAEYYRIRRTTETLYRMSNGMAMFADDIRKLQPQLDAAKVTIARDEDGNEISRQSYRQRVEWFKLNGRRIVDRRTTEKDPLPDRWIPVIRCEGNVLDVNGQVRRKGAIYDMMDPARMVNYWRTKETETIALSPLAPFIAAAGQTEGHPEWKNANQIPHSVLTYEPTFLENPDGSKIPMPPPKRQDPVQVPAGFVQAAQGALQDLMSVAGMPHEPQQDTPGTVVSGVALERRQALSDIGHFQYYDNQTRAIAHTGRILVDLIPHYYSTERMQRIIGEDGVPSMVKINSPQPSLTDPAVMEVKNDLTVGRYDVVMDTGPGYETKRLETSEKMVDVLRIAPLAELSAKVGPDLVFRDLGLDELADRAMPASPQGMEKVMENLPKEAQQVVKSVFGQMQSMQKELQQLQMELKYKTGIELGWMNVEREKVKTQSDTKVHDTEVKARTAMHDTVVKKEGAVQVAEINAGAQLLNTHAEAAHETVARRETLAAAEKAEKGTNGAGANDG